MTASNPVVAIKVLIIEDDPNIVDLIRSNLVVRGFDTVVSAGTNVPALLDAEQPDMVLLDLMLPEADGFELCRQIRERSTVAIIVVSARGGEQDKVTALNMGADDYMTKPFGIEELLARIRATLRRTRPAVEAPAEPAPTLIAIDGLWIDLANEQVQLAGAEVHLTPTEFALLRELAVNRGTLLSRTHLLRRVWGRAYETETEYVRVYISRLRAKLEPPGGQPLIVTRQGTGYLIPAEEHRAAGTGSPDLADCGRPPQAGLCPGPRSSRPPFGGSGRPACPGRARDRPDRLRPAKTIPQAPSRIFVHSFLTVRLTGL
jgi:two-component system KDP operon response regulator KdpE